jgi:DivIVA domain-containing protein
MTDDSFHLTPLDVRRFEFPAALRGYDRARVDAFREQVAEEMDRLTRQVAEQEARAKSFHEQLRVFRDRDKALNDALVSAQQLRGDIKEQAKKEAQLILREAEMEAGRIVEAARAEAKNVTGDIDALERSRRAYLTQLKSLTERQLSEIEAAFSISFAARVVEDATTGSDNGPPQSKVTPVWLKSLVEE